MKKEDSVEEKIPDGITYEPPNNRAGKHLSLDTLSPFQSGASVVRTFEYTEKHEIIDGVGVKFAVENLPSPRKNHARKKKVRFESILKVLRENSTHFYNKEFSTDPVQKYGAKDLYTSSDIKMEKLSRMDKNLVFKGGRAFFDCCVCAFAQHLPLALSPDHIWTLITYAFAKHVDENSEALRDNFVKHDGKQVISITVDSLQKSKDDKPETGSSPEEWEKTVFPEFSEKIKKHIGKDVHSTIVGEFSTTSPAAKSATEITLMASMKKYFSYQMFTAGCGIPEISLLGTEDDWASLRLKAEKLGQLMTKSFSKYWMPLLLPILDKFVEAYQGKVDHGFWQTMVKLRSPGKFSGASPFISGWIQILYPYLKLGKRNQALKPWTHMYFKGPSPGSIPSITSSTPVSWIYFEEKFRIHFHAGFVGFSQAVDGTLSPSIGWWVTHDPEAPPNTKINLVQDEIENVFLGHKEEHDNGAYKGDPEWVETIKGLIAEEEQVLPLLSGNTKAKALTRKKKRPVLRQI